MTTSLNPAFAGKARPGTEILGRIMNDEDVVIDQGYAQANEQGEWAIRFGFVRNQEVYRVAFEPVPYEGIDVLGYLVLEESSDSFQVIG